MTVHELWVRCRYLFHQRREQRELQEEMALHLELRARQLANAGATDAELQAAKLFGNSSLLKEKTNDMWGWRWLEEFLQDLRYATRSLKSDPAFAAVAIITLTLGIGANTAIFSVTNALLLRGLPVAHPEQIFQFRCDQQPAAAGNTGNPSTSFSDYVFQHMRKPNRVLSDLVAYVPAGFNKISVRTGRLPEEAAVDLVSGNFFTGLQVRPACGRILTDQDETTHAPVAIMNYAYAATRFGSACAAVGRPVAVKGVPFVVAGVTPPAFTGVENGVTDIWIPFQTNPELNAWGVAGDLYSATPNWWCILLVGRLRPNVTQAAAEAVLNPVFQRVAYEPYGGKTQPGEKRTRLHLAALRGIANAESLKTPLTILQTMVGLLLLIACGNVSMLLVVRNAARTREFSLRLALGGSKGRLFRQLLTESFVLLICGTLGGVIFAQFAIRILARWAELDMSLAPDRTVLLFGLGIVVAAGVIFGTAPSIAAARISVMSALKTTAPMASRDRSRLANGQVTAVLQLALCLVLLTATGLLVRTLQKLESVDLGMRARSLLVFGLSPHLHSTKETLTFYRGVTERLRSLPQVEDVTLTGNRVGTHWSNNAYPYIDGKIPQNLPSGMDGVLRWNNVGAGFFRTFGIRLIAGRDLADSDSTDAAPVAVVNQTFVQKFFNGRNAIGHTVSYYKKKQFTIVGVVVDSKYADVTEEKFAMAWFPYTQVGEAGAMHVELRTAGPPLALLPKVRQVVADFGPDLAVLQARTQQAEFDETIGTQRLFAQLSVSFSILAALLVAIGLYGTTSFQVARRTSEFGLRMALGALGRQLIWMVLRSALLVAAVGIVLGLALALISTRVLESLLFGVQSHDFLTFSGAVMGILFITVLASLLPAIRAAAVDPMVALRQE